MTETYAHVRTLDLSPEAAAKAVRSALAARGFGVLTEIDVRAKLKEKTGEDVGPYLILGACSPPDALKAVRAERDIGLLLPCNVVIRTDDDGRTVVSVILPVTAMGFIDNETLLDVASAVQVRLVDAIDAA